MLEIHDPANCATVIPDLVGLAELHLRQPLLQRRQQAQGDHARVRLLQLGHSRVRHSRSDSPEEIAYYNPPARTDVEPGLESCDAAANAAARRSRLVLGAGASRRRSRERCGPRARTTAC